MKKTFFILFMSFCFSFLLLDANPIEASSCTINNIEYQLPATIGLKSSYSYHVYDALPLEGGLPTTFNSGVTLISIENENSCLNLGSYVYKYVSSYSSKLGRTTHTYTNILLDINENGIWSYSGKWPSFSSAAQYYEVSYFEEETSIIEVYFYANVGKLTTIEEIKNYISTLNELGEIEESTIEPTSDAYTPSYNILGEYLVSYKATDLGGNCSVINVWVKVVDVTAPNISGKNYFESFMSSPLTVADIQSFLTVSDNYDENVQIYLSEDNFSASIEKIGIFTITFKATDSSNNTAYYTVSVKTFDDVVPNIKGITHIIKGSSSNMSIEYVKSLLTATDNYSGDVTSSIQLYEDTYSENYQKEGNYILSFTATDTNMLTCAPYVIYIDVYDSVPPIFHVDENVIITDPNRKVTSEEILQLFIKTGQISENEVSALSKTFDDYTKNYNKNGKYNVSYALQSDETIKVLSVDLEVRTNDTKNKNNTLLIAGSFITLLGSIFIIKKIISKTLLKA